MTTTTERLQESTDQDMMEFPISPRLIGGRWIALAAFVFVAAWLLGLTIGFTTNSPAPSDSAQTIGTYFTQHRQLAILQAYLLDGVAGAALVVFGASLWTALGRAERTPGALPAIMFGASVAAGAVSLLQGLFTQVLADHVAQMGDAGAIRTLYDLNTEGDTYKLLALGVFLGAAALIILRSRVLPRWIGWVAAVLGPLLAVAGWNFILYPSVQYLAYAVLLILLLVWVAAVGVVGLRRAA
jgi:hypothetical protein